MPVIIDEVHVCISIHEIPDTQDNDEDEDDDKDELFDDNYGDDIDNELFLNGNADYLIHDGGWIREDDRVDCKNNINIDRGSYNNGNVDVDFLENNINLLERSKNNLNFLVTRNGQTSPTSAQQLRNLCQVISLTFVPNYHNKERSTSMQKAGQESDIGIDIHVNNVEALREHINQTPLAIPGQTATGKESSNPFMAGSLPKTIHLCDSLQSDEDSFELIELMILCTNFLTMVRDLENLKTTYLIMKKVWVRMHPNRGGLMMQMQRLPSLMRLQMMLETRTTRFQTAIRSEEVFGYILLVIKKLTLKKLDD
ncbi:hypothetical protein Tco_0390607 [Tanacetum coccineum]